MLILEERVEIVETKVDRLEGLLGHFIVQTEMLINRLERQGEKRAVQLEQRAVQLEQRTAQLEQQAEKDRQQWQEHFKQADERWQQWQEHLRQADERWQQRTAQLEQQAEKDRQQWQEHFKQADERWQQWQEHLRQADERWQQRTAQLEQQAEKDRQQWQEHFKQADERWQQQLAESKQNWNKQRDETDQRWEKQLAKMDQRWEKQRAEDRQYWNKRWGELAQKLGTIAEDIVAPNLPRIARVHFGCQDLEDFMVRRKVKNKQDPSKRREFDVIAVCADKVLINETKSTPSVEAINDFVKALEEVTAYFPEYQGKTIIPIFASLYLDDDLVNYLTKKRIYALAMGDETMELLNGQRLALTEPRSLIS